MTGDFKITPELRVKLKEPFGILIRGSFAETMRKLDTILKEEKPPMIITVGDTVSQNLHEHGILPQISIIDNKSMRRKTKPKIFAGKNIIYVKNPQGTITEEAINAIRESLWSGEQVQIIVDGEEDLLTLIAVLHAPEKTLVVYGQPREGVVVAKVAPETKDRATEILKAMKTVRKAK
jgi:GTP-dependent dephospho-CoA kinase